MMESEHFGWKEGTIILKLIVGIITLLVCGSAIFSGLNSVSANGNPLVGFFLGMGKVILAVVGVIALIMMAYLLLTGKL